MKISNRINSFLFLALACVSITQVPANTMAAEAEAAQLGAHGDVTNALLQVSLQQLSRLDQIAEDVARLISDHQITSLKNPRLALQTITTIRSFLKTILASEQTLQLLEGDAKLEAIIQLIRIGEILALHYKQAFDAGFKEFNPLDPKMFSTLNQFVSKNQAQLIVRMTKLDASITRLETKAKNIGLTWYNKVARKIDDSFIVPIQRNNLGGLLAIGAASCITSWYLLGEYGENLAEVAPAWAAPIIHRVQRSWGLPIRRDRDNRPVDPQGNPIPDIKAEGYTWRSRMVDSGKNVLRDPIALMAFGTMGAYAISAWNEIKEPFAKYAAHMWNTLRGGVYEKAKTTNASGTINFQPTHGFDKVIGLENVKAEFDVLIEFLKNPESAIRRGLIPAKAYLLTGAPGVGKTFTVEAVCGEIAAATQNATHAFRYKKVDAAMIYQNWGIKRILEEARQNAPCVIFIDEIDLLGLQRNGDNKLLSEFLTGMGNTIDNDPMKLVIIIAATNKPQSLDKALLRTGRFKEIRVEYPTHEARKQFLRKELTSYGLDPAQFDLDSVAQETDNHTIEDLRGIIRRGIITSWMVKVPLNQAILDYGLNKELHHIMLEDARVIPVHEQKLLAAYFAGRAFALNLFDTHDELAKVTTKPVMAKIDERSAWQEIFNKELKEQATIEQGCVFTKPKQINGINMRTKQELLDMCKSYLAGTAAQELLLNNASLFQDNSDHDRAFACAQRYVLDGLDPDKLSPELKKQYQQEAHVIFTRCKEEVKKALGEHKKIVQAIADALETQAVLSGNQVKMIIEKNKPVVPDQKIDAKKKSKSRHN